MNLTPKQRLLRAIRGQEVDRIPFSPFLAYYFEALPEAIQAKGQLEYLEAMGADPLLRGDMKAAYGLKSNGCTSHETVKDGKKYTAISTPKGKLYLEHTYVPHANTWFLTKHPVSNLEDLYLLKLYFQDLTVVNEVETLNGHIDGIGERALLIPYIPKSAFQDLLEHWIGTENLVYMRMDHPDEIREVVDTMAKVYKTAAEYTAMSRAELCLSWEDSSTTNVSPSMYREFIAPEITVWCDIMNNSGKGYVQHVCGYAKDLLLPMAEQGVLCLESLAPPPTGNVTIAEACQVLPKNISIIGGIDPIMMLDASPEEMEEYARGLLKVTEGRGFVLANSDSCPPGVDYNVFLRLADIVRSYNRP